MPKSFPITVDNCWERAGLDPEPEPRHTAPTSNGNGKPFDVRAMLERCGQRIIGTAPHNGGTKYILEECPFDSSHRGKDVAAFQGADGKPGFKCLHQSCSLFHWKEFRAKIDSTYDPHRDWSPKTHDADRQARGTKEEATAHREPVSFTRITAAELDAGEYELEYLIEGTMTAGQPLILAGGKKNLKTNILLDAAISLASGKPFLGKLTVNRQTRVAVMTGESGLATIQETARRICGAKGLQLAKVDGLIFSPDIPRAELTDHLAALEAFIRNDGIEVLAIDPAYMSLPGDDAGNLFKQGALLRDLTTACTEAGASLILAHHTKKNIADPFKPPELEDIAWSGFQEFARQWWMLARRESYQPGTGDHKLWFSVGGSAGHSALWALNIGEGVYDNGRTPRIWSVEMLSASDAREAAKQGQAEQRAAKGRERWQASVDECTAAIEKAFVSIPGNTENKRTIEDRSGKRGKAFDEAFAYLLRTGRMKECKLTRANKQEYDAFQFKFEDAQK